MYLVDQIKPPYNDPRSGNLCIVHVQLYCNYNILFMISFVVLVTVSVLLGLKYEFNSECGLQHCHLVAYLELFLLIVQNLL
jgi:hypothetical protein